MGRWSSTYYDEVLGSKLKSLVCGAIERAKLEKDDPPIPSISYENFVQDLDHGDSFTTLLFDILVKELADRKTRPSSTDRHLIADRTARALRSLGTLRTFRDRSTSSRRPLPAEFFVSHNGGSSALDWDALTQGPEDEELEIEDDGPREVRYLNGTESMYPPFTDSNSASSNATARRSFHVQTTDPGTDDEMPSVPMGIPSRRSPPAHTLARHSALTRPTSIRRPARTRTNDFSDFTTRRRISGRHDQASQSVSVPGPSSRPNTAGAGDSSSSMDIANLLHNHHNAFNDDGDGAMPVAFTSSSAVGPFGRRLTRVRSADERDFAESVSPRFTPSFTLHSSGSSTGAAPSSSRMHVNAPRLRRGGVRAPEQYTAGGGSDGYTHTVRISSPPIPGLQSLSHREDEQRLPLPRRSSSTEMEYIIQTASDNFNGRSPRAASPLGWGVGWNGSQPGSGGSNASPTANTARQQSGTPTNLPTPRSISPENHSRE